MKFKIFLLFAVTYFFAGIGVSNAGEEIQVLVTASSYYANRGYEPYFSIEAEAEHLKQLKLILGYNPEEAIEPTSPVMFGSIKELKLKTLNASILLGDYECKRKNGRLKIRQSQELIKAFVEKFANWPLCGAAPQPYECSLAMTYPCVRPDSNE